MTCHLIAQATTNHSMQLPQADKPQPSVYPCLGIFHTLLQIPALMLDVIGAKEAGNEEPKYVRVFTSKHNHWITAKTANGLMQLPCCSGVNLA